MNRLGMMPFNDGSATHFSIAYGTFSAIDITFGDPGLYTDLRWGVHDDLCHSDHFPIRIGMMGQTPEGSLPERWILKDADWGSFEALVDCELGRLVQGVDSVEGFAEVLQNIAAKLFLRSGGKIKRASVPWWNAEVKEAIHAGRKAYQRYRRNQSEETLSLFRQTRARTRFIIKQAKLKQCRDRLNSTNCHTPVTKLWDFARAMRGNARKTGVSVLKTDDDEMIDDPKQMAEMLAKRFEANSSSNSYDPTFKKYKNQTERKPLQSTTENETSPLNFDFTQQEFDAALASCHESAPGPDTIHFIMLKHLSILARQKLLEMFNRLWRDHEFPETWREATMIPILKPGKKKDDPDSYRPISLTNCMCKLMEKMVNYRLMWHLESTKFIDPGQFAFRKMRSTADVHVTIENEATRAFKEKQHLVVVSLDMQKAYDRIWRRRVLETLTRAGVKGNMLEFIRNFMSDRRFRVAIGSTSSNWYHQENGIPQGSVLSVTLFLVAVNEIVRCKVGLVQMVGFADDWYLLMRHRNMTKIQRDLQRTLNKLVRWSKKTGYSFSSEKTKAIHLCRSRVRRRPHVDPTLLMMGEGVEVVREMIFDRRLSWGPHLELVSRRAKSRLCFLRAVTGQRWGVDEKSLLLFNEALVVSTLEYGVESYSSASKSALQRLDAIYNDGLRVATGAFRTTPVESLYALTGKMSLGDRRQLRVFSLGLRISALQGHPMREMLFDAESPPEKSFLGFLSQFSTGLGFSFESMAPSGVLSIPPWLVSVEADMTVCGLRKADTAPVVMASRFREVIDDYPGYMDLYTDGSKEGLATGAAAIVGDRL